MRPSVRPVGFISTGSKTVESYLNRIENPSDERPMELFMDTTTDTFVQVNELVSRIHTSTPPNETSTASDGSVSDSIGSELPAR